MLLLLRLALPSLSRNSARRHPSLAAPLPRPVAPRFPSHQPFHSLLLSPLLSSSPASLHRLPCSPPTAPDYSSSAADDGAFDEELGRLLVLLPEEMRRRVEAHPELRQLIEVVMDLGRRPLARFPSGDFVLSDRPISSRDLLHAASQVGDFGADNRAGISRTLHRISAIRNRKGAIIGLTCRVGRAVTGSASLLRDLVKDGGSLLLIGPPGVGKTTIIREIARMLADDYRKRVMIVDTSNEIGGDGDIPHAGIGSARRLQVPDLNMQHKVLIEAVENHMPQVIVIDEIGTKLEAVAARTIAQRGIQLVATAHGVTIENLIMNPSLEMLVGGIQSVTLGDEEANRRGVQKTVLERKGPSTFTCGAEIISKTELHVHRHLEATVDALLSGSPVSQYFSSIFHIMFDRTGRSPHFEVQKLNSKNPTHELSTLQSGSLDDTASQKEDDMMVEQYMKSNDGRMIKNIQDIGFAEKAFGRSCEPGGTMHLYIYGISETSILQAIKQLGMDEMILLTDNISEADAFLVLHSKLKNNSQIQAVARSHGIPIYVTKTCSLVQITKAIRALMKEHENRFKDFESEDRISSSEKLDALEEARLAIEQVVIPLGESVQLLPRPSYIIAAQIDLIERYKLKWEKVDQGTNVCILVLALQADKEEKLHDNQIIDSSSRREDLSSSDDITSSMNGVTRLPFLPD